MERYPQVMDYYKNLTRLRRNHPAFRLGSADLVRRHLEFLPTQPGLVAFRLKDYAGRDDWRNIIVIINAAKQQRKVAIPQGNYTIVCHEGKIDENGLSTFSGSEATVSAQSALILHD